MKKTERREKGDYAENEVVEYLRKNKYKIVARNWAIPPNELDIVAMKDDTLVFVEVKAGDEKSFESPEARITKSKINDTIYAATCFISSLRQRGVKLYDLKIRFDAATVTLKHGKEEIKEFTYYENYFIYNKGEAMI